MNDVKDPSAVGGITTEMMTGGIVIGAIILLVLIKRGFRGVNLGGFSVGVK